MKRLLIWLAVLIAVGTAPATASAQDQPISGVCAFPIEVTYLANDEMARVTLPSGVVIQTGRFVVRITNADTGTSTDLNVSGPVFTDASGNGTYRGEALLFFGQTGSSISRQAPWSSARPASCARPGRGRTSATGSPGSGASIERIGDRARRRLRRAGSRRRSG